MWVYKNIFKNPHFNLSCKNVMLLNLLSGQVFISLLHVSHVKVQITTHWEFHLMSFYNAENKKSRQKSVQRNTLIKYNNRYDT